MQQKYHTKVLIIEDSPGDVFIVERMLYEAANSSQTFDIVDVPRLVDAFQAIEEAYFDVVLLDLNLLDIDGVASVAALHAEIPNTPILVYSGMNDSRLKEHALLCGASDYLVKGCEDGASLKHAIERNVAYCAF